MTILSSHAGSLVTGYDGDLFMVRRLASLVTRKGVFDLLYVDPDSLWTSDDWEWSVSLFGLTLAYLAR
jgi:hypothetical protein